MRYITILFVLLATLANAQSGKIYGKQEFTDSVKLSKYKNARKQVTVAMLDSTGQICNTPNFTFNKFNSLRVQSANGVDTCLLEMNDSLTDAVDRGEPHVIGSRIERHDNAAYSSVTNFDGRVFGLGKFCTAMISKRVGGRDIEWVFDADSLGGMIAQAGSGFFKFDDDAYTIYAPFRLPAGGSAGYVLTSDASGYGTWQAPSAGGSWSTTGQSSYTDGTHFIGTQFGMGDTLIFRVSSQQIFFYDNTSNSTAIGNEAGTNNSGQNLIAIGYQAGINNTGNTNVIIGDNSFGCDAGTSNMIGYNNSGGTGSHIDGIGSNFRSDNYRHVGFAGDFARADQDGQYVYSDQYLNLKLKLNGGNAGDVLTNDGANHGTWKPVVSNGATGSEPSTPYLGQLYFNTTLTKLTFWNGSVWAIIISAP